MARRRVRWSESAWDDVERIAEYIARDSKTYAAALVRELREASRSLDQMAERGRRVPEFKAEHIRELIVRRHRLIYRVSDGEVLVLGIVHGAQDLRRAWRQRGPSTP